MTAEQKNLQTLHAQTRLLLALWELGGSEQEVKKSLLTKRIVAKGQKMADYKDILEDLQGHGAVTVSRTGYTLTTPIGLDVLSAGLRSGEFKFEGTIVGTWAANALLRWIGKDTVVIAASVVSVGGVIGSYEEFKSEIIDLFDKLDKSYSHAGLVPIWQIRKEVENRLQRDQFNAWIMDMQAEQLLYLQSGEARGATEEQKKDSINSEIRGLLFFASKPV